MLGIVLLVQRIVFNSVISKGIIAFVFMFVIFMISYILLINANSELIGR